MKKYATGTFGDVLQKLGFTQIGIGKIIGVDHTTVMRWAEAINMGPLEPEKGHAASKAMREYLRPIVADLPIRSMTFQWPLNPKLTEIVIGYAILPPASPTRPFDDAR